MSALGEAMDIKQIAEGALGLLPWLKDRIKGLRIVSPSSGDTFEKPGFMQISGICRFKDYKNYILYTRRDNLYWPQRPIDFDTRTNTWTGRVWADGDSSLILLVEPSEDIQCLLNYYSQVNAHMEKKHGIKDWVPISMPRQPKGFKVLDSIKVVRK
jgi:hypothetical protein